MTNEDINYFKTTKTMLRRSKTMLKNLAERVEISEAVDKFNFAEEKIENALSMLQLVDPYTDKANENQLEFDFGG